MSEEAITHGFEVVKERLRQYRSSGNNLPDFNQQSLIKHKIRHRLIAALKIEEDMLYAGSVRIDVAFYPDNADTLCLQGGGKISAFARAHL